MHADSALFKRVEMPDHFLASQQYNLAWLRFGPCLNLRPLSMS